MMMIVIVIMAMMGVRMSGAMVMHDAFHMMMMAALRRSDFRLETQDLGRDICTAAVHAVSPVSISPTRSTKVSITSGWSLR